MGFLGVYRAIYDYAPQGDGELTVNEGDILYILEKSGEDDWWRAKKKATPDDDEEPEGLVPNNYIEEAKPLSHARALYDYTRQTDEELSFTEGVRLEVFDTSDPDWILVGYEHEYGFVPANYIDMSGYGQEEERGPPTPAKPPSMPARPSTVSDDYDEPLTPPASTPAAAIANIMGGRSAAIAPPEMPRRPQYTPEASDDEALPPAMPQRPQSQIADEPRSRVGVAASPPYNRATFDASDDNSAMRAPGGFRMYNINEMVSVMGKRKKMPTTLGINHASGTILIAPEKARDGPEQEWTAEKMTHYSIEGKHVFLELVKPSKSVDFHAGSKDTAQEIDSALRDLAGSIKAEGLREVMLAASGIKQKTGVILYDFMAQGEDEVSVAVDDEVIVVDDTKSEEWWQVRRVKNGKEGVVPSSYVEITGTAAPVPSTTGLNAGRSTVENNRLEEERLAKEALRAARTDEVGPSARLPQRGSSLSASEGNVSQQSSRSSRRESKQAESSKSVKSKPDPTKVRSWTDRSKTFRVEAQFLGLKDGKINLHKLNGVKIAVPVTKMSVEDLEYVEGITGISLDEDKPLSEIKKKSRSNAGASSTKSSASQPPSASATQIGASVQQTPAYDWFPFFLSCDVPVGMCERYAQIFNRDSMDESVLPDVDGAILRNLGIREGDIIKIMRSLDTKYNRKRAASYAGEAEGGLFSGPGGALRNNTSKGRPAPPVQTNDVVDARAFSQEDMKSGPGPSLSTAEATKSKDGLVSGFDDDAWSVKPSRDPAAIARPKSAEPTPVAPARPQAPALSGALKELSLLDAPLEPTRAQQPVPPTPMIQQPLPQQAHLQPQPTGANPSFFAGLNSQTTGLTNGFQQNPSQISTYGQQPTAQALARQRPAAPQYAQNNSSLMPPPPARPLSAPQSAQQSVFAPPPLQPQMTGMPSMNYQTSVAPQGQQSLDQMRLQQQYTQQQQMQPQMTGFPQSNTMIPIMAQPTGYSQFIGPQNGFAQTMQPQQSGFAQQAFPSQFADSRGTQFSPIQPQATGFQSSFGQQQFSQQTGVNGFLPPALQPQKTGFLQPQATGTNGFGSGFGQQAQPAPIAALVPQKTGPPPPVRFGVTGETKKLMPQVTGRRANLSAATPQNPFGF